MALSGALVFQVVFKRKHLMAMSKWVGTSVEYFVHQSQRRQCPRRRIVNLIESQQRFPDRSNNLNDLDSLCTRFS